jgi:hypothetical protein
MVIKQADNNMRETRDIDIHRLRVELYKLYYFDSMFDLNVKGDSSELLTAILKLIHGCFINKESRE